MPQEQIGAAELAGMVQPAHGGITANGKLNTTLTFSQGYLRTNFYGMVLSSASD